MIRATDIRKLSDFRQHATTHLDQLSVSGRVEVLTVNGEAKGVVMSPSTYDALAEKAALLDRLAAIGHEWEDIQGSRGEEIRQAVRQIAAEVGIKLDR